MTASNIAKWFLYHNDILMNEAGADLISNLKLQKLLYYAQGSSLAIIGESLFDDKIEAWKHGPVVPNVYHEYKHYGDSGIEYQDDCIIGSYSEEIKDLLEQVYDAFGKFSAWELRNMTHNETPWRDAYEEGHNNEITIVAIKQYFENNYIVESEDE